MAGCGAFPLPSILSQLISNSYNAFHAAKPECYRSEQEPSLSIYIFGAQEAEGEEKTVVHFSDTIPLPRERLSKLKGMIRDDTLLTSAPLTLLLHERCVILYSYAFIVVCIDVLYASSHLATLIPFLNSSVTETS
eukprot:gb/GECG01008223.1/.p1 GENE.gb/GECG01008223.1/~~gb/GECG01008223.1/.p1  ORF type:complete len:135 (+),score=6.27 gb/GECG01008223.1/:1-405(+)